jgi:site-specific recombinase XerD
MSSASSSRTARRIVAVEEAHLQMNPEGCGPGAYKRAVDRFLRWCQERGLELRQVTSFLIGEYLEHHLLDRDGHPLTAPSKKQHLAALRHFFDNQQIHHGVVLNPAASVCGPKHVAHEGKTPRLRRQAGPRPLQVDRHR